MSAVAVFKSVRESTCLPESLGCGMTYAIKAHGFENDTSDTVIHYLDVYDDHVFQIRHTGEVHQNTGMVVKKPQSCFGLVGCHIEGMGQGQAGFQAGSPHFSHAKTQAEQKPHSWNFQLLKCFSMAFSNS